MWFDRTVGVTRDRIGVFKDDVCFLEPFLNVTLPRLAPMGDVRPRLREEPWATCVIPEIRMHQHGIIPKRLCQVEDGFQFLVNYLHEFCRSLRCFGVSCDHGSDLFADKADTVCWKTESVLHVQSEAVRKIFTGDYAYDTRNLLGGRCINALDQFMCVRGFYDTR